MTSTLTASPSTTMKVRTMGGLVHTGRPSRFPGMIVLACSGRTVQGAQVSHDALVSCEHCAGQS